MCPDYCPFPPCFIPHPQKKFSISAEDERAAHNAAARTHRDVQVDEPAGKRDAALQLRGIIIVVGHVRAALYQQQRCAVRLRLREGVLLRRIIRASPV